MKIYMVSLFHRATINKQKQTFIRNTKILQYKKNTKKLKPCLVVLCDLQSGNGAGPIIYSSRGPQRAQKWLSANKYSTFYGPLEFARALYTGQLLPHNLYLRTVQYRWLHCNCCVRNWSFIHCIWTAIGLTQTDWFMSSETSTDYHVFTPARHDDHKLRVNYKLCVN